VYEAPRSLFVAGFVGESNLFSGTVLGPGDDPDHVQADLEGLHCTLAAPRPLRAGTRIHVLLRPEDLRVYSPQDPRPLDFVFRGTVLDRNYKGMTLDSVIRLENGKTILASEF